MATRVRQTILLAVVAVVALAALLVFAFVKLTGRAGPLTSLTVTATTASGGQPTDTELDRTRDVLLSRMRGMHSPSVTRQGDWKLVLAARGTSTEELRGIAGTGQVQFRAVVATPDSTTALPAPGEPPAVAGRLGAAYTAAAAVSTGAEAAALPAGVLDAFRALSPADVATLPVRMQLLLPSITCKQLTDRRTEPADRQVVACDGTTRYLLDPATVSGRDIASAKAGTGDTGDTGGWSVTATFTLDGQARFTELTRQLAPRQGQLAILADAVVISAPTVTSVITKDVVISGTFTQKAARALASQLDGGGGELPLELHVS